MKPKDNPDDKQPFGMGDEDGDDKPTEAETKKKAEEKEDAGGCEFC